MTGPFPGMDPYLEAQGLWESFHAGLVTKSAEALNQRLPEDYVAQIKTRDKIETEVEVRERWIEISALPDLELVTVVEILSPSNKSGSGRSEYLHKRDTLIDLTVNLVEIDLLLSGRPMPMGKDLPAGHYLSVVARRSEPAGCRGLRLDHLALLTSNPDSAPVRRRRRVARPGSGLRPDLSPGTVQSNRAPRLPAPGHSAPHSGRPRMGGTSRSLIEPEPSIHSGLICEKWEQIFTQLPIARIFFHEFRPRLWMFAGSAQVKI